MVIPLNRKTYSPLMPKKVKRNTSRLSTPWDNQVYMPPSQSFIQSRYQETFFDKHPEIAVLIMCDDIRDITFIEAFNSLLYIIIELANESGVKVAKKINNILENGMLYYHNGYIKQYPYQEVQYKMDFLKIIRIYLISF